LSEFIHSRMAMAEPVV